MAFWDSVVNVLHSMLECDESVAKHLLFIFCEVCLLFCVESRVITFIGLNGLGGTAAEDRRGC